MLTLSNDQLVVSVLDPSNKEDRRRLGTRYCTGGYIFQVEDRRVGPLLSGPTFPDSFNVFDGQGIPDAFNRMPLRDVENPRRGLIIGVGLCDLAEDQVIEACRWDVRVGEHSLTFRTRQSLGKHALDLQRRVELLGRTVRSTTWLDCMGSAGFQISWYPHPFFPQPETDELCRISIPVSIRPNPGYEMTPGGFIARMGWPWTTDYYLALDHHAHAEVTVLQRHPRLGLVGGTFGYVPRFFPIWGNPNTFSWEPYYENSIAPGQGLVWWMAFDF